MASDIKKCSYCKNYCLKKEMWSSYCCGDCKGLVQQKILDHERKRAAIAKERIQKEWDIINSKNENAN